MKIFPALFLLFSLSACASSGDFSLMRQDVEYLKRETFDMKKEISSLKGQLAGTAKEVERLTQTSGSITAESFSAVRESQADINSRLSEISMNLQELRGRFEENKYYQEKITRESATDRDLLRAQILNIDAQIKVLKERMGIEKSPAVGEPPRSGAGAPEAAAGTSAAPEGAAGSLQAGEPAAIRAEMTDERVKNYESAYQLFRENRFKEAREKFGAFTKDYPANDLTDNAHFWIAETYYAEKDFESAILAYETVLKKFPDSEKTPGSLMKQGFAFIEIGDIKTGRLILQKLIEKFPNAQESSIAKKKIAELEKKPGR